MAYTKSVSVFHGLESWYDDNNGQPRILFVTDSRDEGLHLFWSEDWPELYDWLVGDEPICPSVGRAGDTALIVRLG